MLLNTYFKITDRSDSPEGTVFSVVLLDSHHVYDGHFPGDPVSPGVCNLQMIKECAELLVGKKLHFTTISQYRLMEVMSPTRTPNVIIQLSVSLKGECLTLVASVRTSDLLCITVKGELVED